MKALKYFLSAILLITFVWGCEDDDFGSVDFVSTAVAPTNVTALYNVTQDNTGFVTITPNGEGAISYDIYFGDETASPVKVDQGKNTTHTYAEGTYTVKIVAKGITGLKTEVTQELVISFKSPENLEVTIENDVAVSKQVNVTATADYAASFDVYFGEEGNDEPVTANIGDMASYAYAEAGTYTIRVVAKGAAIATTEYTVDFEATAILQPIASAPTPESRAAADVISIYGDAYATIEGTNYNPDWGQSGQGSGFAEFDLDGDLMLQYINLSYQGIGLADGTSVDVSAMEFLHMDVWTANVTAMETSLINGQDGNSTEAPVWSDLTADQWTSIDIPISDYIDQGLTVSEIFQLKLVGDPWAGGTVFIDNIFFYRAPSIPVTLPLTFDSDGETFGTFNGASFAIDADPESASNPVGMITNSGAEWEGISLDLDEAVDFSVDKQIKLDIYSTTTGSTVLLKFENGTDNAVEVAQTITQTGWSELVFDFSAANYSWPNSGGVDTFGSYNSMVMFIDGGQWVAGTYYIDNLEQVSVNSSSDLLVGTWKLIPEAGALMVGDSYGAGNWWTSDAQAVIDRACLFDDTYVFNADGSFNNVLGIDTWLEDWQGTTDACGTPVAPHDGLGAASYTYDDIAGTVTLNGTGAYLGIPKANNAGELPNVAVPTSITYDITLSDNDNTMSLVIETGTGVFWSFKLIKEGSGGGTGDTAPYNPIDFEVDGFGADWTWSVFENDSNPAVEIVGNPDASGINTSSTVAKITALQAGQPWVGCETLHGADIGSFTFDSSNSIVKIMVYKTVISDVGLKFAEANGEAQPEVKVANTKINEWEELTFDLSGSIGAGITGVIDQIIIFPDFDARTQDNVIYFDNITFGSN